MVNSDSTRNAWTIDYQSSFQTDGNNAFETDVPRVPRTAFTRTAGKIVEYRCRVGHTYSPLAMENEHQDTVERSLWSTVVALEEAADISEKLAPGPYSAEHARKKRAQEEVIKGMLSKEAKKMRDGYPAPKEELFSAPAKSAF